MFTCVCVQGSVGTGVQVLSVSHSGIKLLKTVKSSAAAPDYFRVLRPYTYVLLFLSLPADVHYNFIYLVCFYQIGEFYQFVAIRSGEFSITEKLTLVLLIILD